MDTYEVFCAARESYMYHTINKFQSFKLKYNKLVDTLRPNNNRVASWFQVCHGLLTPTVRGPYVARTSAAIILIM